MAQTVDSFNDRPDPILHDYSTILGLIAGQQGSKYAPMIDFTSAWITIVGIYFMITRENDRL